VFAEGREGKGSPEKEWWFDRTNQSKGTMKGKSPLLNSPIWGRMSLRVRGLIEKASVRDFRSPERFELRMKEK
jgi:hypothetical protein